MAGLPKWLTESDVRAKLSVPKEWWDIIIRPLFGDELDRRREIELWAVDGVGMFWEFRCAVRQKGRYKKPVLQSDGWLKFVNYKGLGVGDMVILDTVENQFRGTRFLLRACKYDADGQCWFDV
ncbi:hypothetical protein L484_020988 [Morus notabilis]|uniref:TF-B3 domain-containing protein n=1 Tax=Morus notabilis TaxID=981085 RepID=W9QIC0_9ROSA|nr:hypothetical protein L484_020988 [Morus notabilis]